MIKTKVNFQYAWRQLLFHTVLVGWGIASFYDWSVRYPAENAIYEEQQEAYLEDPKNAPEPNKDLKHSKTDIKIQFIMGTICFPAGLIGFLLLGLKYRKKYTADEDAMCGFTDKPIQYSELTELDKRLWDSKGIFAVRADHEGESIKVVLDDWKFAGFNKILEKIEEKRSDLIAYEETEAAKREKQEAAAAEGASSE